LKLYANYNIPFVTRVDRKRRERPTSTVADAL